MKKIFRKSILALALALVMAISLTLPSFAATSNNQYPTTVSPALSTPAMPVYTTGDNGGVALTLPSRALITQWETSGCTLHGSFSGSSRMRQIRLAFDEAYALKGNFDAAYALNSTNILDVNTTYGRLRNYLSAGTINQYVNSDAYGSLRSLQNSWEYRQYGTVQAIVNQQLATFDGFHAVNLRRSLAMFMPEALLKEMSFSQLMYFSRVILNNSSYIQFYNALYGHDCSTVRALLRQGYSLDYVARLYTSVAESSVRAIWPDYNTRINTYIQNHGFQ